MDIKKSGFSTISLPTPLIEKIREKIQGTGFHSPSSYVAFILRQVLSETEGQEKVFSKEAEKELKTRLRSLGYL